MLNETTGAFDWVSNSQLTSYQKDALVSNHCTMPRQKFNVTCTHMLILRIILRFTFIHNFNQTENHRCQLQWSSVSSICEFFCMQGYTLLLCHVALVIKAKKLVQLNFLSFDIRNSQGFNQKKII